MAGRRALDLALDLISLPALAEPMRRRPLPPDVLPLIRIAAGCEDTCREAARITGKDPSLIREAARFYLQQVVLHPGADSHQTLGVTRGASREEQREHMRWLMKWLHPDRSQSDWEAVFAQRVLYAWRDLARSDQRTARPVVTAEPVARTGVLRPRKMSSSPKRGLIPWIAQPIAGISLTQQGARWRLIRLLGALIIAAALLLLSNPRILLSRWSAPIQLTDIETTHSPDPSSLHNVTESPYERTGVPPSEQTKTQLPLEPIAFQ